MHFRIWIDLAARLRAGNALRHFLSLLFLHHTLTLPFDMRTDGKNNLELAEAADIWDELDYESLEVIRRQYEAEEEKGILTTQTTFNYAWALVKSSRKDHQEKGVLLLQKLYKDDPSRRRESLYFLGVGYYKLGKYTDAQKIIGKLLEKEPTNEQAISLNQEIENKLTSEAYIGGSIVAGAVAVAGGLLFLGLRRARK
ncbi:TPR-like protein [Schizopora paradoxa]|uniref:Mitochondrial fission 1 protein n=1 Tax=Schizopora paradoxa TaxID=27342 RepID=A0A0H2R9J6_9AGAM|nr:TPR-like protein [Schizopora paradoxa]